MVLAHLTENPVPPFEYVQEPGMLRLSEILMRMMAKSPADRFDRPDDLRDELLRALAENSSAYSRLIRMR
jgi:hypothetical protein